MAANDVTSIQGLVKTFFNPDRVNKLYQRDYPALARMAKRSYVGDPIKIPIISGRGAGIGSTLSGASASASGVTPDAFLVTPAKYVGIIPLDDEVMQTMESDRGGFVDYVKTEYEAKITGMGLTHSGDLFGNGGGSRGVVDASGAVGDTVTLTNLSDGLNIWKDDIIGFSTTDGTTGALKAGQCVVQDVDRDTGTIYLDAAANITGGGGIAAGDNIFLVDLFSGGSVSKVAKGFRAWNPGADGPATGTFYGVDRTDRPALSGIRLPTSRIEGGSLDRLMALATHMWQTLRVKAESAYLNPINWARGASAAGSQGYRPIEVGETEAIAGYEKLTIYTEAGKVDIMSDPSCRLVDGWLLKQANWWIAHRSKQMVRVVTSPDGQEFVPSSAIVGWDTRLASYWTLATNAPWTLGHSPMPDTDEE